MDASDGGKETVCVASNIPNSCLTQKKKKKGGAPMMQQKQIYEENLQEVRIGVLLWKQLFCVFCNSKGNFSSFGKATWMLMTIAAFLAWTQG